MAPSQVLTLLTVKYTPEIVTKGKAKTVPNDNNVYVTDNVNGSNLIRKRSKIEKYRSWIFAVLLLVLWLGVAYLAQTNLLRVSSDQITRFSENEGIETQIIQNSIQVLA